MSNCVCQMCSYFGSFLFVRALLAKTLSGSTWEFPLGHCDRGLGAIREVCRMWRALKFLRRRGRIRQIPRISVERLKTYFRRAWKTKLLGFCMRDNFFWYLFFLCIFAKITDDRQQTTCGEHNGTTLLPSKQATQCMCVWHVLAILRRVGLSFTARPYRTLLLSCCWVCVDRSCHYGLKYSNRCFIDLHTKPSLHFRPQRQFFTSDKYFGTFFAQIVDDRHQTACGEYNATCTTLPPSSSGLHHVSVARPRHTVADCFVGACHLSPNHTAAALRVDRSCHTGRKY